METTSCPFVCLPERPRGFTLVELAIVLVIIGLIVGGVLVGRELIKSAEIRKDVSFFSKTSAAISAFRLKYNCVPGDCIASSIITGATNGGNNGTIDPGSMDSAGTSEAQRIWQHLQLSGLLDSPYSSTICLPGIGFPTSAISNNAGYFVFTASRSGTNTNNGANIPYIGDNRNWLRLLSGNGTYCVADAGSGVSRFGLGPKDIYAFDLKIDDGEPYTGAMRLMGFDAWNQSTTLESMTIDNRISMNGGPICAVSGHYNIANTSTVGCPWAVKVD